MKLFDAYKHYIVKHPKVSAYKPSSPDYDEEKLLGILKELEPMDLDFSDVERDKVIDFLHISTYLHNLYVEFYTDVQKQMADFNKGSKDQGDRNFYTHFRHNIFPQKSLSMRSVR